MHGMHAHITFVDYAIRFLILQEIAYADSASGDKSRSQSVIEAIVKLLNHLMKLAFHIPNTHPFLVEE